VTVRRQVEGDLVAPGLELVEVVSLAAFGVDPLVVEVGSEVVVAGLGDAVR